MNQLGFCECGCGNKTEIHWRSDSKRGTKRGDPKQYVNGHQSRSAKNIGRWKGGRSVSSRGYVLVYMPNHHAAYGNGYVLEHVVVAERIIGRPLKKGEIVHHKNENRKDNSEGNLQVLESRREHSQEHRRIRALAACGNPNWHLCRNCHRYDDPKNMIGANGSNVFHHAKCRHAYEPAAQPIEHAILRGAV